MRFDVFAEDAIFCERSRGRGKHDLVVTVVGRRPGDEPCFGDPDQSKCPSVFIAPQVR